jgi:hypothetical protein
MFDQLSAAIHQIKFQAAKPDDHYYLIPSLLPSLVPRNPAGPASGSVRASWQIGFAWKLVHAYELRLLTGHMRA